MSDRPDRATESTVTTSARALWARVTDGAAQLRRGASSGPSPRPPTTGERGRILPADPGPVPLSGIDHLEWYVGNAGHTAAWLERLGFRVVARQGPETGVQDIVSLLLQRGGARLLLTSGLTPTHDATRSVAARGDAVLDAAFAVADVEQAYGRIIHSAMEPDHLPVDMWEDGPTLSLVPVTTTDGVLHTLITRHPDATVFAPGFVAVDAPEGPEGPDAAAVTAPGITAVTVVVAPGLLDDVLTQYRQLFDLAELGRDQQDDVEAAVLARPGDILEGSRLAPGALRLVFASPTPRTDRNHLDDFLSRHGGSGVRTVTLDSHAFDDDLASWRDGRVRLLEHDGGAVVTVSADEVSTRRVVSEPLQPRTPLVVALEDAVDGVADPLGLALAEEAALAAYRTAHPDAEPLGTWKGGR